MAKATATPHVSVIVPHYQDLDGLALCLAALDAQTYPRDRFEIVIADNNSPCGLEAVEKVIAGRAKLVSVLEKGAGPARNGAVAASRGEVLAFYGLVGAGRTEAMLALMGLKPEATARVEIAGRAVDLCDPAQAIAAGLAYVPEDRRSEGVLLDFPVRANLTLPALDAQTQGFGPKELAGGHVSVVNVFASWCIPCHVEAPVLMQLAAMRDKDKFEIYGFVQRDTPDKIRAFLAQAGNPFSRIGNDVDGRAGIEWGVYGVPETFVVGRDGNIAYKLIGPVTADNIDTVLKAEIEKALRTN